MNSVQLAHHLVSLKQNVRGILFTSVGGLPFLLVDAPARSRRRYITSFLGRQ